VKTVAVILSSLSRTVDHLGKCSFVVVPSRVGSLEIVEAHITDPISAESGLLVDHGAGETGSPALFRHGSLVPLHTAVALGPAGGDEAVLGSVLGHGSAGILGAVISPIVCGDCC